MTYKGETLRISLDRGGLVGTPNFDMLEPFDMVDGSRNINLHLSTRAKRGGTAHVNASAFTDTPQVMGIFDFRLRNGTQFIMSALKDGKVYKDDTTAIKTGMSTANFFDLLAFNNLLYVCDGATIPQTWDGAAGATANLTAMPTDWTGSNYPQFMIKHGRGNSEQLWAFGCPLNNNTIYVSKNDDDDFADLNVATIAIETGDGFGLVAGIEFGDRLIAFGKTKSFLMDDTDASRDNWGYNTAQWYGGAAHFRLVCETPNDIVAMMEDGEIYSVRTAEQYGDYKQASITRPADMHKWIADNVALNHIDKFHMLYDPVLRAVRIFFVKANSTNAGACLLYYIDRPPEEAWMVHDNSDANSGFDASAAAVIRVSQGSHKIYTGDYSGNIWKLEEVNKNDNNNPFYGGFKTPPLHFGNQRTNKKYRRGVVVMEAKGDYNLIATPTVDGQAGVSQKMLLDGAGAVLGSFILDTDILGASELIDRDFDIGDKGKRLQIELYNSSLDQDFDASVLMIDHKVLGAKPQI